MHAEHRTPAHLHAVARALRRMLRSTLLGLLLGGSPCTAQTLDTIVFGNTASETAHALATNKTEVIAGQLGQSARRCLPLDTVDVYGGDLSFTMAVDPNRRNYVSLRLWGGDDTDYQMGRLYLYVPLGGTNYQIGYRHEGDYMPLSVTHWQQPLPGRFFYSTTLLPLWMTKGRTSLTLKFVSTGRLYPFGSGGPAASNPYQYGMDRPGRGIYRAYTHVDPFLDVSGETQGSAPATTTRPSPGAEVMASGGSFFNGVSGRINNRLATTASVDNFSTGDVSYLGRAYSISGLPGYQNAAVVTKVTAVLDAYATNYYTTPSSADGWGGNFGPLGRGIHDLRNQLTPAILDTVVDYGSGGSKTRRAAWADMLFASREHGRLGDRRTLSNQVFIADSNIYYANKGLLALGDSRAFPEADAQRYLKEACGLLPWLGNDLPDANGNGLPDDGSAKPFGGNYYQVTTKGLTREWGFVGAGYGELPTYLAEWYRLSGNTVFRDQMVKMAKARAAFRRPAVAVSGTSYYRSMEATGLLAWRGAHESDGNFAGFTTYVDTLNTNEGAKGLVVAAASGDPVLTGYAKQMLADNQYFYNLSGYYNSVEALESFADYQTVKNATDSGARLPMTDGQPDFVWSDEEGRILALKQGGNRLWITPYWQAKSGTGINAVARFHFSTPAYDQYGVLETMPQVTGGLTYTRPNLVDMPEKTLYTPPDAPTNAYAGEIMPLAPAPADATDNAPFRGKADYYAFRFGRYLIGLNAHATKSYPLKTPVGFTSGTNLVTGAAVSGPLTVSPMTTVVVDVGADIDTAPVPSTPLALTAAGSSAPSITLTWTAASGAETYTVRRSSSSGGPYTPLAAGTGLTALTFTDAAVSAGATYYYVVVASNANGTSYESSEASASAGVPPPWATTDVGSAGVAGYASYMNLAFTVSGAGSTVGGTADSLHFTYLPVTGDGTLVARLVSRSLSGSGGDKIGVMVRDGTGAGSKNVALMIDKAFSDQARMSFRSSTNGGTTYDNDGAGTTFPKYYPALPYWLKLERTGNQIRGSISPDGNTWTNVGAITVGMSGTVNFGLFCCSRNTGAAAQGNFDSVNVQPGLWGPPPPAPTGLGATPASHTIGLAWTASASASSYRVKRALTSGGPYAVIATTGALSYSDQGLVNGTPYYYVVSALNPTGESPDSAEIEGIPATLPPDAPTGLTAVADDASVSLFWNASFGATGYQVKRATSSSGPFTSLTTSPVTATAYADLTAANNTVYYYVVTATGEGGEGTATQPVSATPSTLPSTPAGLFATAGNESVVLGWSGSIGATGYTLYRATSSGGPFTALASGLTATSYTDGGLANGATFYYKVTATNTAGESAASPIATATPISSAVPPPWSAQDTSTPGIAGTAAQDSGVFTLTGSGADIGGTSDQFQFVSQPAAGTCEIIARVTSLSNTDAWSKAGLMIRKTLSADSAFAAVVVTPSSTNGVRFQARTTAGAGATEPGSSTGTTRLPPEWLRLTLSGTTVTAYRSDSTTLPTSWTSLGTATVTDLTGGFYIGLVVSSHTNSAAATAAFSNVTVTTGAPSPPANLTATAGARQAVLAWSASSGATSYTVKRAVGSTGPFTTIASGLTTTSYTNGSLVPGNAYYYVVSASNATGESGNSAPALASVPTVPTGLAATAAGGRIALTWTAFPGAAGYVVKRGTFPGGPYTTLAAAVAGTSYQDATAASGQSSFYVVSAIAAGWRTYDSAEAYATRDMPVPWLTVDVGTVTLAGSAKYSNGVTTMTATGSDIGASADNFRIACLPLTGDGAIVARLTTQVISNTGAKTGLMMRETLASNSRSVMAVRQANSTARFATRTATGGGMNYVNAQPDPAGISLPCWLKLERAGNTFTASTSPDGSAWTPYATSTVTMNAALYAGFCSVSRNATTYQTSAFDSLSITGWTAPPYFPTGLTANNGTGQITLGWTAAAGATGYNLRRSTTSGGPYDLIAGNLTGSSFTDTGLTGGTTCYYVISSLGTAGESTESPEASGTALDAQQAWRLARFGTIENAGVASDSSDPDGDGWNNTQEYLAGTDPNNPASLLKVTGMNRSGSNEVIAFLTVTGKTYRVERSDTLTSGTWTTVQDNITGTGTNVQVIDSGGGTRPRRFYRIAVH